MPRVAPESLRQGHFRIVPAMDDPGCAGVLGKGRLSSPFHESHPCMVYLPTFAWFLWHMCLEPRCVFFLDFACARFKMRVVLQEETKFKLTVCDAIAAFNQQSSTA